MDTVTLFKPGTVAKLGRGGRTVFVTAVTLTAGLAGLRAMYEVAWHDGDGRKSCWVESFELWPDSKETVAVGWFHPTTN